MKNLKVLAVVLLVLAALVGINFQFVNRFFRVTSLWTLERDKIFTDFFSKGLQISEKGDYVNRGLVVFRFGEYFITLKNKFQFDLFRMKEDNLLYFINVCSVRSSRFSWITNDKGFWFSKLPHLITITYIEPVGGVADEIWGYSKDIYVRPEIICK